MQECMCFPAIYHAPRNVIAVPHYANAKRTLIAAALSHCRSILLARFVLETFEFKRSFVEVRLNDFHAVVRT